MTASQRLRQYFRVLFAASAMILATVTVEAAVRYVTQGGAGDKDGRNWDNAYDEAAFPAAILSAGAGDEIRVRAGVYRPSTTNDQSKSFVLKNGVAVYGGFAGTETSSADRDPAANVTVLTGDLASDDEGRVNGVTTNAGNINGTNSTCVVRTGSGCGATTVLDGFTITAGDAFYDGGGMNNFNSSPTVTNCAFSGNRAGNGGGGMCNDGGAPTAANCVFSGNTAWVGGGMYNSSSSPTVTNCAFSGNIADSDLFGGGGMFNGHSNPTVTNCTFSENAAVHVNFGSGGGMYNYDTSSPTVTNCAFSGNTSSGEFAGSGGGGMYNSGGSPAVTDCAFSGNSAKQAGGGMYNNSSSPTVTNCAFSGNTSSGELAGSGGGGIYNSGGSPTVTDCAFSGNSAKQAGGGMYNNNSDPTVTNCTFFANSIPVGGDAGGGMYNSGGNPAVANCTFSGNEAYAGGGMCNESSTPAVMNCTFSGNTADVGGGMSNFNSSPTVTNCIFWNGSGGEISNFGSTLDVSYCVVSGDDVGTGTVSSDIISADPLLGSLAYNGGPTKTHALSAGSSAIDAASPDIAPDRDQRGVARPQGSAFDIGAYEYWEKKILTVQVDDAGIAGNGFVTRSPKGDVVGTTGKCWGYPNGTSVTLFAVEESRDWFVTWSGDASGTTSTASVTMSCDRYVGASFDVAWLVTVSAGAGGDITPSAPGVGSAVLSAPGARGAGTTTVKVREGWNQTFTVIPDTGYSIGSVRVDGVISILGAGSKYTFANVSADHSIEATFAANPTPTDSPAPTSTPVPTATPTPVPTPDPDIPLPKVTLTITLYAGGTIVAGPFDVTDPATLSGLLASPTLLAQLLATDPAAILSGVYNMDLVRFFSLVADLDPGVLDFTILLEIRVEGVPSGYRAQLFMLTRTFDSKGNPTGYSVVPRSEGENVFRKGRGARGWTEAWRVTVRDGSASDGDAKQDGSVAPQIAAVVAVFPMATPTPTMTPTQGSTGSGGGCSIPESGGAVLAALLLLAPILISRRR